MKKKTAPNLEGNKSEVTVGKGEGGLAERTRCMK